MSVHSEATVFDWAARRVMVTGANGFVGRWLVRALVDRGAAVTAVVRHDPPPAIADDGIAAVAVAVGNVADTDFIGRTVQDSGIDTVFHLAGVNVNRGSTVPPRAFLDAHLHGAYAVLEASRVASGTIRVVLASSQEVEDCLLPEPARRMHPYMASKAAAELITRAFHDTFETPVVVLRSQNIYGGGDTNWERLIPGSIRSLLQGDHPVIKGTGRMARDFV
ncbi:MAG: NAD-dependent epimerase/dehydratase family protein, partial [Acidimicrobiia bacterium]